MKRLIGVLAIAMFAFLGACSVPISSDFHAEKIHIQGLNGVHVIKDKNGKVIAWVSNRIYTLALQEHVNVVKGEPQYHEEE